MSHAFTSIFLELSSEALLYRHEYAQVSAADQLFCTLYMPCLPLIDVFYSAHSAFPAFLPLQVLSCSPDGGEHYNACKNTHTLFSVCIWRACVNPLLTVVVCPQVAGDQHRDTSEWDREDFTTCLAFVCRGNSRGSQLKCITRAFMC